MDIGIPEIIAAVFIGNMATLAVVFGLREASKYERGAAAPWWALFSIALPCLYFAGVFYVNY